jgi:hypothetical protein
MVVGSKRDARMAVIECNCLLSVEEVLPLRLPDPGTRYSVASFRHDVDLTTHHECTLTCPRCQTVFTLTVYPAPLGEARRSEMRTQHIYRRILIGLALILPFIGLAASRTVLESKVIIGLVCIAGLVGVVSFVMAVTDWRMIRRTYVVTEKASGVPQPNIERHDLMHHFASKECGVLRRGSMANERPMLERRASRHGD